METETELTADITDELSFDPRILDISRITVAADSGSVVLAGVVGTYQEKLAAGAATQRVRGVTNVDNELEVGLATGAVEDEALRTSALEALTRDGAVPIEDVGVRANDGLVTLTGTVSWRYQRAAAEADVARLLGVVDIDDQIRVVNEGSAPGVSSVVDDLTVTYT